MPVVARNATALAIALLVLLLGVRPLLKTMGKKRDEAAPATAALPGANADPDQPQIAAAVTLDQLESANGFDERVGAVRGFTRDNPARAALAIRDMIKADAR